MLVVMFWGQPRAFADLVGYGVALYLLANVFSRYSPDEIRRWIDNMRIKGPGGTEVYSPKDEEHDTSEALAAIAAAEASAQQARLTGQEEPPETISGTR